MKIFIYHKYLLLLQGTSGGKNSSHDTIEEIPAISHQVTNVSKDVDFLLWTRRNPIYYRKLHYNKSLPRILNNSHFSPNIPTKLLIHGYGDTGTTDWIIRVKNKYLNKGKLWLPMVNWNNLIGTIQTVYVPFSFISFHFYRQL